MDINFDQLFNQVEQTEVFSSLPNVLINLLLAMVLGIIVAKVYKHTHKGISYSASYAYSIVLITMIVAFVMMVIGGNVARAFTLLGAFTLIRFRTAVKDPKDTAFIFLALVVGLAVGANDYALAIAGTIVTAVAALTLDALNFGSLVKLEQVLYLTISPSKINQKDLETILKNELKQISIINVNYSDSNKLLQYSYNIQLKKKDQQAEVMEKITAVEGVKTAEILASQQVIEF